MYYAVLFLKRSGRAMLKDVLAVADGMIFNSVSELKVCVSVTEKMGEHIT